jgi:hypothetical protein
MVLSRFKLNEILQTPPLTIWSRHQRLLKQLQFKSNRDFSILLQQQRERLLHTWQSTEIDALEEQQFDDMKQLLAQDAHIKAMIENEKS